MSRITIASLVNEYNALAASFDDVKTMSPKTSLARATIIERLDALRERAAATTETITLVELAARHNRDAKSVRARFRALARDPNVTLPTPVALHTYRVADIPRLMPYIVRTDA